MPGYTPNRYGEAMLAADWRFCRGSHLPDAFPLDWPMVSIPHTWNARDGQDGGNDYWRGTATYCARFSRPERAGSGDRVFLQFDGVAMSAEVHLNGQPLGSHKGGYSRFRFDITDHLREDNLLVVHADNGNNDEVYPQKADFTFYGGIYRPVRLIVAPAEHFEMVKDGSDGIKITPTVDLAAMTARVKVETWQNAPEVEIELRARPEPGLERGRLLCKKAVESRDGRAEAEFTIENVRLWDGISDPYMYQACARLKSGAEAAAMFGCREFRIDPEKGFFLNGRPYPLRGVAMHQDHWLIGSTLDAGRIADDINTALELGANTLRLAHYQHSEYTYSLCDRAGLVVWTEIPYITAHMDGGRANTLSQMRELITQNYNHPSIACWGLSNEISASGGVSETLLSNHRELNELCHRLDQTRPTTMAHAFMLEQDSPLARLADVSSYNLYFGWYMDGLEQNERFFDEFHAAYPDYPIGFSEYGADANPAYHSSEPERGDYTEEYQCLYHEHILNCIENRPFMWATHAWNLFDFAADGRDEGGKHGINQKGLVTFDRSIKKDAFYLYRAAWSREQFVHVCGRRYVDRAEDVTEIKVYSNLPRVALYVDGKLFAEQEGSRIFRFRVPLSGAHRITAAAGLLSDTINIRRAAEPNPAYIFRKKAVINWFDRDTFKPDCYSIRDTMGTLKSNPQTAELLAKAMEPIIARRGDVAKAANANPNLQRMMANVSLENMIRQAGDSISEEDVRALNEALQRIKK